MLGTATHRVGTGLEGEAGLSASPCETPLEAADLMARIVSDRDREAFKALFLAFAPRVRTFLLRRGAPPALAEELSQEAMLTVWRKAEYYRAEKASVSAWIYTIARNLHIDRGRRELTSLAYELAFVDPEPPATPETETSIAEREERLRQAVQELPEDQMQVIRLSFFQDMPHSEIARDLALPLGTVKSRLRLAVAKLRTLLGDLA